MVTLARDIREALMAVIEKAVTSVFATMSEQWITADELCQQFQMFTPDWLAKYGDILPRKQAKITHVDGTTRKTRWAYPRYKIAKDIADGLYDDLKLLR